MGAHTPPGPQVQHSETGDALWVSLGRKGPAETYALDYVVERKGIKDLVESIRGGRYERQKYALRRCGLRRVMYLIEGTPEAEVAGVGHTSPPLHRLLLRLLVPSWLPGMPTRSPAANMHWAI